MIEDASRGMLDRFQDEGGASRFSTITFAAATREEKSVAVVIRRVETCIVVGSPFG